MAWQIIAAAASQAAQNGLSALSGYISARAQKAQYRADEKTALANRELASKEADFNENAMRRQYAQEMANLAATLAERGITADPAVMAYTQAAREGQEQIFAYRTQMQNEMINYANQAKAARYNAQMARVSGRLSVLGGVLGAASSAVNAAGGSEK